MIAHGREESDTSDCSRLLVRLLLVSRPVGREGQPGDRSLGVTIGRR